MLAFSGYPYQLMELCSVVLYGEVHRFSVRRDNPIGVMQTLNISVLFPAGKMEENIGKPVQTTFQVIIWHNILILLALHQFFQGNDFLCVSNQVS